MIFLAIDEHLLALHDQGEIAFYPCLVVRKLFPERVRAVSDGPFLDTMLQDECAGNIELLTVTQVALLKVYCGNVTVMPEQQPRFVDSSFVIHFIRAWCLPGMLLQSYSAGRGTSGAQTWYETTTSHRSLSRMPEHLDSVHDLMLFRLKLSE